MLTKIIATIGPATSSIPELKRLASLGVSICRMNFSHGNHEVHGNVIRNIRAVQNEGIHLGIMLDTKGPEVRTGDVEIPIIIKAGQRVVFRSTQGKKSDLTVITVDYPGFAKDVRHARCILVDNGAIEFTVERIDNGGVIARAKENGTIGSRRHVNLPGAHISLPSFTEQDWKDIRFGIEQKVDFIATSFVRSGADLRTLRKFLLKHGSDAHIIAKIETPEAVDNIDGIVQEADGIMVARGDLGAEVPFEEVPAIQDRIVALCREAGKPVIVATQMLESMILSPMPTRAEVTDIAYAARSQADCTMLSGETTTGKHPFRAVDAMARVLRRNERSASIHDISSKSPPTTTQSADELPRHEQARCACFLAATLSADAIVVMSRTGRTARSVAQFRPPVPIIACTTDETTARKLTLVWGTQSVIVRFYDDTERTAQEAITALKKLKLLKAKQRFVLVSDISTATDRVMTIQIRHV